jgi:hypothetical protein
MPAAACAARAAVLVLLGAASSLATLPAGRRLSDLSVEDVQQVLREHNLAPFMAKEFAEFLIDGEALSVLSEATLAREDFPSAKRFHWDKFFAVLNTLRRGGKGASVPARSLSGAGDSERRYLSTADQSAIHIKRDAAALVMGAEGDVALERTGEGELSVHGRLLVADSAGDMVDVADTLEALGAVSEQLEELVALATKVDQDTRVDTLTATVDALMEMVTLNTELLMNVSAACNAAAAEVPEEVPLYTCKDALLLGAATGRFATEDFGHVHCNNDISGGGWTLALNIDTSDNNVVDYANQAFWEHDTALVRAGRIAQIWRRRNGCASTRKLRVCFFVWPSSLALLLRDAA